MTERSREKQTNHYCLAEEPHLHLLPKCEMTHKVATTHQQHKYIAERPRKWREAVVWDHLWAIARGYLQKRQDIRVQL